MTIPELEKKIKAESPNAKECNWALSMNYNNIVHNTDDNDAHKSWLYLKGVLAGLYLGSFLTGIEYGNLECEINTAYNSRHQKGEQS